jgi:hypothetical protein
VIAVADQHTVDRETEGGSAIAGRKKARDDMRSDFVGFGAKRLRARTTKGCTGISHFVCARDAAGHSYLVSNHSGRQCISASPYLPKAGRWSLIS